jgi:hypothetical protein
MVLVLCVRVYCGGWAVQGLRSPVSGSDILGPRVIEPGSVKFSQVHTCVHTLMCTRLLYARSQYRSPAAAVPPAVAYSSATARSACFGRSNAVWPSAFMQSLRFTVLVRTMYAYICDLFMSWLAAVPCATQQHPVAVPPVAEPLIRRSHTVRLW